ncbi:MAG: hypothetical protein MUF70_09405, partial [Myxococcota bacterium]|nr:hypothetical protein [Myxococcota bacterium]
MREQRGRHVSATKSAGTERGIALRADRGALGIAAAIAAGAALLLGAADARAFAWFDGKLELHGFVAQQIRSIANDLDPEEEFDL